MSAQCQVAEVAEIVQDIDAFLDGYNDAHEWESPRQDNPAYLRGWYQGFADQEERGDMAAEADVQRYGFMF